MTNNQPITIRECTQHETDSYRAIDVLINSRLTGKDTPCFVYIPQGTASQWVDMIGKQGDKA